MTNGSTERFLGARFLVALTMLLLGSSATAAQRLQPDQPAVAPVAAAMIDETPRLWFVELSGAPTAEGTSQAAVETEHAAFRRSASESGVVLAERHAFTSLFNGFSVMASRSEIAALRQTTGVAAVFPVASIPIPAVATNGPELFTAIQQTGAAIAQTTLGLTGRGVKVGIIDTGVDYDHADLGGDGVPRAHSTMFPNARVVTGWDFVGDAFNADATSPTFNPTMTPDPFPDDCNGHGTHVAGIVGASGLVTGVAPEVSFGAYRVFGCEGSTTADVMIAAMERALADGMDVVNMSIGAAYTWPQYPTAVAASRLARRGVVVVASIGNSGDTGLWSAGAPGVGRGVIGVASFDNTHVVQNYFTVPRAGAPVAVGYFPATGAPLPPTTGSWQLARTGTPTATADGCAALPAGSLAGQVALIRRGTCSFAVKSKNAQDAGAVAVVLYNNAAGFLSPTVAGGNVTIPVVATTASSGALLDGLVAAGAVSLTWTPYLGSFPDSHGGLISSFSSWGLTPDLELKPDIGAPGGNIFSTFPLEQGSYASLSGTSMASPHVAGTAALFLQARPHADPAEVRAALQATASPRFWTLAPGYGLLDAVSRQGAGMVQIDDAVLNRVAVEPSRLALGESQAGPVTRELEIENRGRSTVTYDLGFENTISVAGTFTQAYWDSDATVAFSRPSITLRPGHEAEIRVTITPPTYPDQGQYGGYLLLTPRGGGQVLRVPYAGFVGDYQSIRVLTPTANGFPWLALQYAGSFYGPVTGPDDWVYSMAGEDIPYFLLHLDHPSRLLQIDIYDARGRLQGQASLDEYLPRNATATGFYSWSWDGTVQRGKRWKPVADGLYTAKISVLKALGHHSDPADWETWTSPVMAIQR